MIGGVGRFDLMFLNRENYGKHQSRQEKLKMRSDVSFRTRKNPCLN